MDSTAPTSDGSSAALLGIPLKLPAPLAAPIGVVTSLLLEPAPTTKSTSSSTVLPSTTTSTSTFSTTSFTTTQPPIPISSTSVDVPVFSLSTSVVDFSTSIPSSTTTIDATQVVISAIVPTVNFPTADGNTITQGISTPTSAAVHSTEAASGSNKPNIVNVAPVPAAQTTTSVDTSSGATAANDGTSSSSDTNSGNSSSIVVAIGVVAGVVLLVGFAAVGLYKNSPKVAEKVTSIMEGLNGGDGRRGGFWKKQNSNSSDRLVMHKELGSRNSKPSKFGRMDWGIFGGSKVAVPEAVHSTLTSVKEPATSNVATINSSSIPSRSSVHYPSGTSFMDAFNPWLGTSSTRNSRRNSNETKLDDDLEKADQSTSDTLITLIDSHSATPEFNVVVTRSSTSTAASSGTQTLATKGVANAGATTNPSESIDDYLANLATLSRNDTSSTTYTSYLKPKTRESLVRNATVTSNTSSHLSEGNTLGRNDTKSTTYSAYLKPKKANGVAETPSISRTTTVSSVNSNFSHNNTETLGRTDTTSTTYTSYLRPKNSVNNTSLSRVPTVSTVNSNHHHRQSRHGHLSRHNSRKRHSTLRKPRVASSLRESIIFEEQGGVSDDSENENDETVTPKGTLKRLMSESKKHENHVIEFRAKHGSTFTIESASEGEDFL
ncbi:hypothetical protein HDU76_001336 [Blyttiomyces sp. JEL0837]|nr:hypothetical protein HDU76_001336 [Blyttiomyces sp. JEL0837]